MSLNENEFIGKLISYLAKTCQRYKSRMQLPKKSCCSAKFSFECEYRSGGMVGSKLRRKSSVEVFLLCISFTCEWAVVNRSTTTISQQLLELQLAARGAENHTC